MKKNLIVVGSLLLASLNACTPVTTTVAGPRAETANEARNASSGGASRDDELARANARAYRSARIAYNLAAAAAANHTMSEAAAEQVMVATRGLIAEHDAQFGSVARPTVQAAPAAQPQLVAPPIVPAPAYNPGVAQVGNPEAAMLPGYLPAGMPGASTMRMPTTGAVGNIVFFDQPLPWIQNGEATGGNTWEIIIYHVAYATEIWIDGVRTCPRIGRGFPQGLQVSAGGLNSACMVLPTPGERHGGILFEAAGAHVLEFRFFSYTTQSGVGMPVPHVYRQDADTFTAGIHATAVTMSDTR